jgi:hypothetical protein
VPKIAAETGNATERPTLSTYLAVLAERYPTVFNQDAPRPLAIGADQQVAEALELAPRSRTVHALMAAWCERRAYLTAVAAEGSQRFYLDGTPADIVSEKHRQRAREMLAVPPGKRVKPKGDRPMPKLTTSARRIKLTTVVSATPFVGMRVPDGAGRVEVTVVSGNRRLMAMVNAKSVRKVASTVAEHGPDAVVLVLQGVLGPDDQIEEVGLTATVKAAANETA